MIAEAVSVKMMKAEQDAQEAEKRRQWRKDNQGIDRLKELTGN